MRDTYYRLHFQEGLTDYTQEVTIAYVPNELELFDSEIDALPNCFSTMFKVEEAKRAVEKTLKLVDRPRSPMRVVEEYMLGSKGQALWVFLLVMVIMMGIAIFLIESDIVLKL